MRQNAQECFEDINVLEIRNYLLKPNLADTFRHYFHSKFAVPMWELGGYTLGEYKIPGNADRFVWFRGFKNMAERLTFLNDFYINSEVWKEHGKGANEMMINSDNVYLLKPLYKRPFLKSDKQFTIVDFYICNQTKDKVINLFETTYIPFLNTINIEDISFWVSEMAENDFPRLPAFQDKNLIVSIANFQHKDELNTKQKAIDNMPARLAYSFQELVTIHHKLVLENYSDSA